MVVIQFLLISRVIQRVMRLCGAVLRLRIAPASAAEPPAGARSIRRFLSSACGLPLASRIFIVSSGHGLPVTLCQDAVHSPTSVESRQTTLNPTASSISCLRSEPSSQQIIGERAVQMVDNL